MINNNNTLKNQCNYSNNQQIIERILEKKESKDKLKTLDKNKIYFPKPKVNFSMFQ